MKASAFPGLPLPAGVCYHHGPTRTREDHHVEDSDDTLQGRRCDRNDGDTALTMTVRSQSTDFSAAQKKQKARRTPRHVFSSAT
jgi:hypothetical protein